jgi:hypothetical protein
MKEKKRKKRENVIKGGEKRDKTTRRRMRGCEDKNVFDQFAAHCEGDANWNPQPFPFLSLNWSSTSFNPRQQRELIAAMENGREKVEDTNIKTGKKKNTKKKNLIFEQPSLIVSPFSESLHDRFNCASIFLSLQMRFAE